MVLNGSLVSFAGGIQLLAGEDTTVILPVVLTTVSTVGICGNLLVLLVLIHSFKTGRGSEAHALLVNMSTTDLLILVLCAPLRAVTYHRRIWTLGYLACRTSEWLQQSFFAVKTLTLATTSHMRHNFSSFTRNDFPFRPRRALVTVVTTWIVGLVLPIPNVVFSKLQSRGNLTLCVYELHPHFSDFMGVFSKMLPLTVHAVPCIFAVVCYIRTIILTKPRAHENPARQMESSLMLLSVTAAHGLMLLPEWSSWMWARHNTDESCKPPAALLIISQVCAYLSSALTPAIVLSMVEPFRESLSCLWLLATCRDIKHNPKAEGNGSEVRNIVTNALDNLGSVSQSSVTGACIDTFGRTLPDLEHFWTERRNTTVAENHDPFPWERLEQSSSELRPL
ncbi:probable G-protein coupled receptor 151 [Chanos chanos]|uniref:Probable G-protein coupled receptor 151 n=1 Tax=Chanos chanos TaxID=29144 RepID=A0A6J2VAM3_CHACN|nr:probable G-protein coupled receptor 151 [Chanos chanos]